MNSAVQGYGSEGSTAVVEVKSSGPASGGSLPLTGFDLGSFMVVAMLIIAMGVCMRAAGKK